MSTTTHSAGTPHSKTAPPLHVNGSILSQPKAVWAVFFASIIAFMGLGLVDPILPAIAEKLEAS